MATVIELEPDVEALVTSLVEQGRFGSASEAVNVSLRELQSDEDPAWVRAVAAKIGTAREQLARGEGAHATSVFADLEERYRTWPR